MNESRPPSHPSEPPPVPTASPDEVLRTCPNCGRRLEERKVQAVLSGSRCGFYLSCADYY